MSKLESLVELCLPVSALAIGIGLAVTEQEICEHHCLLDKAVDWMLPEALDAFSGGAPFMLVGLVLLANALLSRRPK